MQSYKMCAWRLRRQNLKTLLVGKASPVPPKAPLSPKPAAVEGGLRILAAPAVLWSPGANYSACDPIICFQAPNVHAMM